MFIEAETPNVRLEVFPTMELLNRIKKAEEIIKNTEVDLYYVCFSCCEKITTWHMPGLNWFDFHELKVGDGWLEFSAEIDNVRYKTLINNIQDFKNNCYEEIKQRIIDRDK